MSEFQLPSLGTGSFSFTESPFADQVTSTVRSNRQAIITAPVAVQQNKGTPEILNTIEQAQALKSNLLSQDQQILARANTESNPGQKQIYLQAHTAIQNAIQTTDARINELQQNLDEHSNLLTESNQMLIEIRKARAELGRNLKGISFAQMDSATTAILPLVPTENPLLA